MTLTLELLFQAAKIAVNATVLYLNWIKDDLADFPDLFPKFIGLSTGSTLCFVIDTTGSMGEEIACSSSNTNYKNDSGSEFGGR